MIVLGIDPGTTRLGFAILSGSRMSPTLVASGVIGDAKLSHQKRLKLIYDDLSALIRRYKPDLIATEKLFFSKNVKTALTVAEARGIILLTAEIGLRKVYECTPQDVKIALTGHGAATKQQVAHMTKTLLRLERSPRFDDESDAMAIALTAMVSIH